jgi:hypothetical protein
MAGGYFSDGVIERELGAHVFATPATARRTLGLDPAGTPAVLLDSGGGVLELSVTGQRVRQNLGDAERYIHDLLSALAASGPGELGFEDESERCWRIEGAVCVGAVGRVRAFRFADMQFEFWASEHAAPGTTTTTQAGSGCGALPDPPGTYEGTGTLQDYSAGGVVLGTHPAGLHVEMMRQWPPREIPRARGARATVPPRGAHVRLTVSAHALTPEGGLSDYLRNLAAEIGPGAVELTANGNAYSEVLLERLRPEHTDACHTAFTAEFLQQL